MAAGAAAASDRLASLYLALRHDLFTVACHLTGERAAAEDVVHDLFAGLASRPRELPAFPTLADARRYLATACAHRVRDRERRRRPERASEVQLATAVAASGGDLDPFVGAAAADEAQWVRASLAQLPAEQRAVVTLHLHGGLKFREVATTLAIPLDTATSRYRYALAKLARLLAGSQVEE